MLLISKNKEDKYTKSLLFSIELKTLIFNLLGIKILFTEYYENSKNTMLTYIFNNI